MVTGDPCEGSNGGGVLIAHRDKLGDSILQLRDRIRILADLAIMRLDRLKQEFHPFFEGHASLIVLRPRILNLST